MLDSLFDQIFGPYSIVNEKEKESKKKKGNGSQQLV
jgi:hypothetical protein